MTESYFGAFAQISKQVKPDEAKRLIVPNHGFTDMAQKAPCVSYSRLRLSPSKMIAWDECKAKFRAALYRTHRDAPTIYTAIGTAAHYVVEQINLGEKMSAAAREDMLKRKLIEICAGDNIPITFTQGFKDTRDVVVAYEIPDGWKLMSAEQKMVLEFPDYDFAYIVDAIFVHDDTIYIIDYKTSAHPPKNPLQLMLYAWATSILKPNIGSYNIRTAFHMLRTNRLVHQETSPEILLNTDAYMVKQVALMERCLAMNVFPTTGSKEACHFCQVPDCEDRE